MKKLSLKFGNVVAALAFVFATMSVNAACRYFMYQEPIPESVKKLKKVR